MDSSTFSGPDGASCLPGMPRPWPHLSWQSPLLIKTGRAVIESVDNNMIQASFALGLSEFQTAVYIVLPLARKGILAGVILSFARAIFLRL